MEERFELSRYNEAHVQIGGSILVVLYDSNE